MYSLLIKDRGFPVHLYLQHMMKFMNMTRAEAAQKLGEFAHTAGLKESIKAPLNNTMSDWLRNPKKTPQWAVVSSMRILELTNRIPHSRQEWAFWAAARIECNLGQSVLPESWPESVANLWLTRARGYNWWYSQRNVIKRTVNKCSNPLLAAKVIYTILGDGSETASYPDVFFSIDESVLGQEQISSAIKHDVKLSTFQVEHVRLNDKNAQQTYLNLNSLIMELVTSGVIKENSKESISIKDDFISDFLVDQH
ncbi:hypothetical protein F4826_004749 [Rahnella inusitata]|nr:hypothetical protein [Rahnella inusitata]